MSETSLSKNLVNLSTQVVEYGKRLTNDKRAGQFATQLILMAQKEPKLSIATPDSLLASLMACVHLDLMPNTPEGLAYIIPYRDTRRDVILAQFQVGYKGLVELAYRSGEIKSIAAEIVYDSDKFKVKLGTERKLVHEPNWKGDRTQKNIIAVYGTAKLLNGETVFDVMTLDELLKIQKSSKAKSTDTPWQNWFEEMAKKTVVKRLLKLLPKSKNDQRLEYAGAFDNWAEGGRLRFQDGIVTAKVDDEPEETQESPTDTPQITHDSVSDKINALQNNDSTASDTPPQVSVKDKIANDPRYTKQNDEIATDEDVQNTLGLDDGTN